MKYLLILILIILSGCNSEDHTVINTVLNVEDGRVLTFGDENEMDVTWYSYDKDKLRDLNLKPGEIIKITNPNPIYQTYPSQAGAAKIVRANEDKIESKSIIGKLIYKFPGKLLVNDEYVTFRAFIDIKPELMGDIVELHYIGKQQIKGEEVLNAYDFTVIEENNGYVGYVESIDGDNIIFNNYDETIKFNMGVFNSDDFQPYLIVYIEFEEIDGVKTITGLILKTDL